MPRLAPRIVLPVAAVAVGLLLIPAAAQPPLPPGSPLRYVPADAGIFVHADAAALWASPAGEAARKAAPKEVEELAAKAKHVFGVTPDQLKTVTVFWPKATNLGDASRVGVVLTFKAPYDQAAMKEGVAKSVPEGAALEFVAKDATTAILLVGGLERTYAAPRPVAETGALTPYLREAAAGGHVVAAGVTLANLPPELRGDLPPDVQEFKALFDAEAAAAFVSLGKELAVEVRVKSATAARAAAAQKALALVVSLARGELEKIPARELADPAMKNTTAILTAVKSALKDARYTTTGSETRARAAVSTDLPVAAALAEATVKVKEAAARTTSFNNLKNIALAMHLYHDTYRSLPPAAVVDKAGRPLLSWRVLILPFIEQGPLYQQFKLDEAWDGPTNKKLLDKMPKLYALPPQFVTTAKAHETHYQAFVGKGAAFDLLKGPTLVGFADGTSNTLMVATAATPVPWTKPDDIAFDPAADMTAKLGYFHGVAHAAVADGSVRALAKSIDRKTLAALITRSGGEVINDSDF